MEKRSLVAWAFFIAGNIAGGQFGSLSPFRVFSVVTYAIKLA